MGGYKGEDLTPVYGGDEPAAMCLMIESPRGILLDPGPGPLIDLPWPDPTVGFEVSALLALTLMVYTGIANKKLTVSMICVCDSSR